MAGDATVSIAIPVYNGEDYLGEALGSVEQQTRAVDELLVFDNCSTDRTHEIAAARVGEAQVRRSATNLGAVANFNRAVADATGEYFAWLGADDRLSPGFVEHTLAALRAHPEAAACLPAIQFIDPDGALLGVQRDPDLASADARTRLRSFLNRPRWTEVYSLYRRDRLLASPRFQDEYGADVLLTWWFLLRDPLVVIDEPLVEYRTYPVKSADATAEGLNPKATRRRWLMTTLWRSLWRQAGEAGVSPGVRRTARRELVRALWHRQWLKHIAWDVYLVAGDVVPGNLVERLRQRIAPPA
ncbi:glycosyltransferase involved in cell wall biosynthesis [Nocardioides sp. BE266]|uniref:glycosyltransferase family 2 protein n=1 Tax=Nocardioides sp. BE266 TaxID=2817725 RepID=UPI002862BB11|nr:glycosyltransferase family 2 protein [Nocardioides sp. BE266]MDR7255339.1 glycosyltransferase involved in cell wall biosynthesis [Nocardioides sp. BE266]